MDAEYANYYTREVMLILIREFLSPDEEMKKIVLKVVKQCCATDGVEPDYIKAEILPPFFRSFWTQRMAMDRRNYRQVRFLWLLCLMCVVCAHNDIIELSITDSFPKQTIYH